MSVQDLINKISTVISNPIEKFESDAIVFSYLGDDCPEKYNRQIQIISGKENVKTFNNSIKELHNHLDNGNLKNKISLELFEIICKNLIIIEKFTEKDLINKIKSLKEEEYFEFRAIYGLTMNNNILKIGEYTFVNKKYVRIYLRKQFNCLYKKDDPNSKVEFSKLNKELKSKLDFVYVFFKYKTIDENISKKLNDKKIEELINILRYMYCEEYSYPYIGLIPKVETNLLVSKVNTSGLGWNNKHVLSPIPILIDDQTKLTKNKNIIDLMAKSKINNLESNVLKSIAWIGKSYTEIDERISIAEIAIAFETLFYKNNLSNKTSYYSKVFSYINGTNSIQVKNLDNIFKKFYKVRGNIVHGNSKNLNFNLEEYHKMFRGTLNNLFSRKEFKGCFKKAKLDTVIKNMKI